MIRFSCPTCGRYFETPDNAAGKKTTCPACSQKIQIPAPPLNKTVLGKIEPVPPIVAAPLPVAVPVPPPRTAPPPLPSAEPPPVDPIAAYAQKLWRDPILRAVVASVAVFFIIIFFQMVFSSSFHRYRMADYNRIREGMSYTQVAQALGADGEEVVSAGDGMFGMKTYTWANHDGSNITASFTNGVMVAKAQLGLR